MLHSSLHHSASERYASLQFSLINVIIHNIVSACERCVCVDLRLMLRLCSSRCVRVILAQGPCESSLYRSNVNG